MVVKKSQQRLGFKTGEYVVYPAHGVGVIVSIEEQEVAGLVLELFVISFEQDKLTCAFPLPRSSPSACANWPMKIWLPRP